MNDEAKQRYALHHLALLDMERVVSSMDLLASFDDKHVREALFRDAVVSYAKPFSNNRGLAGSGGLRVDDSYISVSLRSVHKEVLALRNQLFAHMDIDRQAPDVSVELIDGEKEVIFSVTGYGRVFTEHLIEPLRALAEHAHSSFMDQLDTIKRDA